MPVELPRPIRGIITPMLTPLASSDRLDEPALECLVAHLLDGGVQGLFVLGSCGEGPSLSHALRRQLIKRTCELAGGRCPVLVGISDTSLGESVKLARHAARCGASGVVVSVPYYYPPRPAELREFLRAVVARLPLPVVLYNIPMYTRVNWDLDVLRLAIGMPKVVGIKESSGSRRYLRQVLELASPRPDFAVLTGVEEHLSEALDYGAHGGVVGGSNLEPHTYVQLWRAATEADHARCQLLHRRVLSIARRLYSLCRDPAGVIRVLKCAASCLGLCRNVLAYPLMPLDERARALVLHRLGQLKLLPET